MVDFREAAMMALDEQYIPALEASLRDCLAIMDAVQLQEGEELFIGFSIGTVSGWLQANTTVICRTIRDWNKARTEAVKRARELVET